MIEQPTTLPTPDGLLALAAGGWGYAEAEWIGGWHARASEGFTHRANSAWPIAPRDLPRTLDRLRDWYGARGLPTLVQCVVGSELDHAVSALGSARVEQPATRQTARVDTVLTALARHGAVARPDSARDPVLLPGNAIAGAVAVTLAREPDPAWLGVYRAGTLPSIAGQVLGAEDPDIRFASATDRQDGSTLAIGRVALARAPRHADPAAPAAPARWAGLAGIEVVPGARRRGLAKVIIRALTEWAAERGVTDLYLEVGPDNTAAVELYRTLGFSVHHAYHYRVIESRLG